jgi:hypothetical protein
MTATNHNASLNVLSMYASLLRRAPGVLPPEEEIHRGGISHNTFFGSVVKFDKAAKRSNRRTAFSKETTMAQVTVFKDFMSGLAVPPGGHLYFTLGPHPQFRAGSINVTAFVGRGVSGTIPDFCEIIQMATRLENPSSGQRYILDCVVRNNGQPGHASWHDFYWIYTTVIWP